MTIGNIPETESHYFIRLKTHAPFFIGPPIPATGLVKAIEERGWDLMDVEFHDADLTYYHSTLKKFYEA